MINKKIWKKSILLITCVGLVVGGTYTYLVNDFNREAISHVSWQAYSPEDGRFGIKFPLDPKESHEEIRVANKRIEFHELSAQREEVLYAVSYLDFPGHWKWLGSHKLLTKSFEMLMDNEPNVEEILYQELSHHKGDPALVYKIKQNGKEVAGKFIISGNTLYRVAVTYPLVVAEEIEPQGFINSFEVRA